MRLDDLNSMIASISSIMMSGLCIFKGIDLVGVWFAFSAAWFAFVVAEVSRERDAK